MGIHNSSLHGIFGTFSSGTKSRQKARNWPNGDYYNQALWVFKLSQNSLKVIIQRMITILKKMVFPIIVIILLHQSLHHWQFLELSCTTNLMQQTNRCNIFCVFRPVCWSKYTTNISFQIFSLEWIMTMRWKANSEIGMGLVPNKTCFKYVSRLRHWTVLEKFISTLFKWMDENESI